LQTTWMLLAAACVQRVPLLPYRLPQTRVVPTQKSPTSHAPGLEGICPPAKEGTDSPPLSLKQSVLNSLPPLTPLTRRPYPGARAGSAPGRHAAKGGVSAS
jgi:hypothetical protein